MDLSLATCMRSSGVDKAPATPTVCGAGDGGGEYRYRILKFVDGSFRLGSVLLMEGSIQHTCHKIWEQLQ